jgi:FtsP/CotA-like multicopper oxidase with cupredoxin domain
MLNGSVEPVIELDPMKTYRIRLININPNVPLILSVVADSTPVRWRVVAKDGADLPPMQARVQPAVQRIGVGETYDFEFTPDVARDFRLRAVDPGGRLRLSGVVRVQGAAQIVR